mmetsp:Transcript_6709/g.11086  ORF Transcript_6709/g.11086 Transcript_6709/m.11086 type:complete len:462 (-) Transcript_6709:159-1544(-)
MEENIPFGMSVAVEGVSSEETQQNSFPKSMFNSNDDGTLSSAVTKISWRGGTYDCQIILSPEIVRMVARILDLHFRAPLRGVCTAWRDALSARPALCTPYSDVFYPRLNNNLPGLNPDRVALSFTVTAPMTSGKSKKQDAATATAREVITCRKRRAPSIVSERRRPCRNLGHAEDKSCDCRCECRLVLYGLYLRNGCGEHVRSNSMRIRFPCEVCRHRSPAGSSLVSEGKFGRKAMKRKRRYNMLTPLPPSSPSVPLIQKSNGQKYEKDITFRGADHRCSFSLPEKLLLHDACVNCLDRWKHESRSSRPSYLSRSFCICSLYDEMGSSGDESAGSNWYFKRRKRTGMCYIDGTRGGEAKTNERQRYRRSRAITESSRSTPPRTPDHHPLVGDVDLMRPRTITPSGTVLLPSSSSSRSAASSSTIQRLAQLFNPSSVPVSQMLMLHDDATTMTYPDLCLPFI